MTAKFYVNATVKCCWCIASSFLFMKSDSWYEGLVVRLCKKLWAKTRVKLMKFLTFNLMFNLMYWSPWTLYILLRKENQAILKASSAYYNTNLTWMNSNWEKPAKRILKIHEGKRITFLESYTTALSSNNQNGNIPSSSPARML